MLSSVLNSFLPICVCKALDNVNLQFVNEIRLRVNKPVLVIVNGQFFFLSNNGLTSYAGKAIVVSKTDLADIVFRACECSVYSSNEQLKNGFLCLKAGVRLGIAGEYICESGQIKTLTNYSSICVRIPHIIKGCAGNMFYSSVINSKVKNTLIISPPGCGKTTLIRDFINELQNGNRAKNILLIDERNEIAGQCETGEFTLISNSFVDVITNMVKDYAIMQGIRVMCPEVIITDEIGNEGDAKALIWAMNSGVNVVATVHGGGITDILQKSAFKSLFEKKYFERFVVLSSNNGPGTYEGIYDENYNRIKERY